MKQMLEYKGYYGSTEIDVEDDILHGKLLFINDVVSYVADSPKALKTAFEEAVDGYLETCKECGDKPNIPFKGTFNVRVGEDRHKTAALAAISQGVSLNDWVCKAIDYASVASPTIVTLPHPHRHGG